MCRRLHLLLLAVLLALPVSADDAKGLVVHEWGVAMRSQTTSGQVIAADNAVLAELPKFVHWHNREYSPQQMFRPWYKPVIHIYGPDGLAVDVRLVTARGRPTVYYPKPTLYEADFWMMGSGTRDAVAMRWRGKLRDEPSAELPDVGGKLWWDKARRVPSSYIETATGHERFIFYEGTARHDVPLNCTFQDNTLTLAWSHEAKTSGPVIIIVNDGDKRFAKRLDDIAAGKPATLNRDDMLQKSASPAYVLDLCRKQWRHFGMTDEEAKHIVDIWADDLTDRLGFLVIHRLPATTYAELFPMQIKPTPKELVRVGMLFDDVSGQPDRVAWLPAVGKRLPAMIDQLGAADFGTRQAAMDRLAQLGDLAAAALQNAKAHADPQVPESAARLLNALKPVPDIPAPMLNASYAPKGQSLLLRQIWDRMDKDQTTPEATNGAIFIDGP